MKRTGFHERLGFALSVITLGLLVAGTKACQEDYDVGSQSNLQATGTPDETDTPGDGDTTPTPTGTVTGTATATATATAAEQEPAVLGSSEQEDESLFGALSSLSSEKSEKTEGQSERPENWLGKIGSDEIADTDGDGYSDELEHGQGTDSDDPRSFGPSPSTSLASRMSANDADLDGVPDKVEDKMGTNKGLADTDGDGATDYAEMLSQSDARDSGSHPPDIDGDGLTGKVELSKGTDENEGDTDKDKLRDDLELALGSDPKNPDSDGDGILDGKEYELGSDPTTEETFAKE